MNWTSFEMWTMEQNTYEALRQSGALQSLTWEKGLVAAAVFLAAFLVATLGGVLVRRALGDRSSGAAFALSKLLKYSLVFAGLVVALGILGLPVASLLLTSTALLVGVGFSLQHIARDFVSGIVLLLEQAIRKNDFVTFGETMGTVQEIGLRSTQLLTRDGTMLIVPNHLLTVTEVSNHSSPHKRARLSVQLPVGFGEDVDTIKEILANVARSQKQVLAEPPPQVAFEEIVDSHFKFALVVWVDEPVMAKGVASELRFAITQTFAQRGIRFPTSTIELQRRRTAWKDDRNLRSA
jgi:small-conductance mechanosensitive channel